MRLDKSTYACDYCDRNYETDYYSSTDHLPDGWALVKGVRGQMIDYGERLDYHKEPFAYLMCGKCLKDLNDKHKESSKNRKKAYYREEAKKSSWVKDNLDRVLSDI